MSKTKPNITHSQDGEKYLEKRLRQAVEKMGGKALKFSSATETGYPDRIVLLPTGQTFFVELKTKGEKPRTLQEVRIEELRRMSFPVFVVDSAEILTVTINLFRHELSKRV